MVPDSVPEVLAPADHPSPQGPPVVRCNGPTGPCVLELGHGGDHIRPLRTTEEDVIEGIRSLKAENEALRRQLRLAADLLRAVPAYGNPGWAFRQHVCDDSDALLAASK
jgi:hypothetical protein